MYGWARSVGKAMLASSRLHGGVASALTRSLAALVLAISAEAQTGHLSTDGEATLLLDCAGHVCLRSDDGAVYTGALEALEELLAGRVTSESLVIAATVLRGGSSPVDAARFLELLDISETGTAYEKAALEGSRHVQLLVLEATRARSGGLEVLYPRLRLAAKDRVLDSLGKRWDRANRPGVVEGESRAAPLRAPNDSLVVMRWQPGTGVLLDAWTDVRFANRLDKFATALVATGGGTAPATHAHALREMHMPSFLAWRIETELGGIAVEQLLVAKGQDGRFLVRVLGFVDAKRWAASGLPQPTSVEESSGVLRWTSERVDIMISHDRGALEEPSGTSGTPVVVGDPAPGLVVEDELWVRGPIALAEPVLGLFASVRITCGGGEIRCEMQFASGTERDVWIKEWNRWRAKDDGLPTSRAIANAKAWLRSAEAREHGDLGVAIGMPDADARMLAATMSMLMAPR